MKKMILVAFLGLAFLFSSTMSAQAATPIIERAKVQCIIGEQADGYLGFVPGKTVSTEIRREVRSINQQRKGVYTELARKNNVTVEVTASLTAEKLIAKAPQGHCVRDSSGQWKTK